MEGVERKSLKRSNNAQFDALINILGKHPEVARGGVAFGSTKADVATVWQEIATKLNILGPPMRDPKGWKKVWIDYKANVRSKCAANKKKIQATGGGPLDVVSLSPLEGVVKALVDTNKSVNPVGLSFGESDTEATVIVNPAVPSTSAEIHCAPIKAEKIG